MSKRTLGIILAAILTAILAVAALAVLLDPAANGGGQKMSDFAQPVSTAFEVVLPVMFLVGMLLASAFGTGRRRRR